MLQKNLAEFFERQCSIFENYPALNSFDTGKRISIHYKKLFEHAKAVAGGLIRIGFSSGTRCLILAESSPRWVVSYMAVHLCGGVDLAIDPDSDESLISGLIADINCTFCFTDGKRLADILKVDQRDLKVIVLEWKKTGTSLSDYNKKYFSLGDLAAHNGQPGKKSKLSTISDNAKKRLMADPASIMLKSTRTGEKQRICVVLTHNNMLSNIEALSRVIPTTELDSILSAYPFWSVEGRCQLLFSFWNGCVLTFSTETELIKIMEDFHPTVLAVEPRVAENIRSKLREGEMRERFLILLFRRLYIAIVQQVEWSFASISRQIPEFDDPGPILRFFWFFSAVAVLLLLYPLKLIGDFLFAGGMKRKLGSRLRRLFTGGDVLARKTELFFRAMNIDVIQAYMKPEASFVVSCRVLEFTGQENRLILHTVGPMLPGTELQLIDHRGEDIINRAGVKGAIYVRGPQVMQGYFGDSVRTNEVLDKNGWLQTGDIGRLTISGELQIIPAK